MVKLLAYWYSRQEMCLKWNSVRPISECFTIANDTSLGKVECCPLFVQSLHHRNVILYCKLAHWMYDW